MVGVRFEYRPGVLSGSDRSSGLWCAYRGDVSGGEERGFGGGEEGALAVVPVNKDSQCDGEGEANCSNRQGDAEDG